MKKVLVVLVLTFIFPLFANAASCPNLARNLSYSSRGSDVVQLQQFLISQNLLGAGNDSGYFGRLTQTAVQQFQCRTMNLCSGSPNSNGYGVVGQRTRSAIANACMTGISQTNNRSSINNPSASSVESLLAQIRTLQQQMAALQNVPPTTTTPASISTAALCAPLMPQTQTLSCPSGQTGSIIQTRISSCPGPVWSNWTTTLNTCATAPIPTTCTPLSPQTQTLSCPSGQTGSITQARNSVCSLGATSPTWSDWQTTTNTCAVSTYGLDYNLTKKCIRTTGNPGETNYFALNDQCSNDGKQWLVANESENAPGMSAPGPVNRSFPINATGSPLSMQWITHVSDIGTNWSVNLKVDQNTYPHPNGNGYFTYLGMMDHASEHGGPFPQPLKLVSSHALSYSQWTPGTDDAARMLVGAQFWWGGKAHILEINLASSQWGDAHPDPKAILVRSDWFGDNSAEYVTLDGSAWGLAIPLDTNTEITIPWGNILAEVLAKGWFSPIGNLPSVVQAVYIGTEVKNRSVGNLWHTDFRIKEAQ